MQQESLSDESSDSENSDSDDEEGTSFRVFRSFSLTLILFSFTVMNGRYKNVSQLEWDNSTL